MPDLHTMYEFVLDQPVFRDKKMHILTLVPEPNCFWRRDISYLYEDLRQIPISDNFYDTVACISTLEHIGMVNEQRTHDFVQAMQEMRRVLKPGGRLRLTVPFGEYRNHVVFQQFDSALLDQAVDAFDGEQIERSFFRYLLAGWQRATEVECQGCRYAEWVAQHWAGQQLPVPLPVEPDQAAAARAVACVVLRKSW